MVSESISALVARPLVSEPMFALAARPSLVSCLQRTDAAQLCYWNIWVVRNLMRSPYHVLKRMMQRRTGGPLLLGKKPLWKWPLSGCILLVWWFLGQRFLLGHVVGGDRCRLMCLWGVEVVPVGKERWWWWVGWGEQHHLAQFCGSCPRWSSKTTPLPARLFITAQMVWKDNLFLHGWFCIWKGLERPPSLSNPNFILGHWVWWWCSGSVHILAFIILAIIILAITILAIIILAMAFWMVSWPVVRGPETDHKERQPRTNKCLLFSTLSVAGLC